MRLQNLAAIVLAAGKGTRMKSQKAKVLHDLCGRPLVYYPVKRALEAGAKPIVVVVGYQAAEVEATLKGMFPDAPLKFVLQKEPLGTAHAVRCTQNELKAHTGPLLILSADVPLLTSGTLARLFEAKARSTAQLAFLTTTLSD